MYIQRMRFGTLTAVHHVWLCLNCITVYHWEELWKSLVSLLDFLATKVDAGLAAPAQNLVQHVSEQRCRRDAF